MRLERARAAAHQAGLDGIVATSFENVAYLSGVAILTQRLIPDRLAAVILPVEGDPVLVACSIETAQVRAESWIDDVVDYVEFRTSPVTVIAEAVTARGLSTGRLGIETGVLTARYADELARRLPSAELHSVDHLLSNLRAEKSEQEADHLAAAALSTDRAIRAAFASVEPGTTERAIASHIAEHLLAGDDGLAADSIAFLVVAAGQNASVAHPTPTDRPIEAGDLLRCDVGGYFGGYYSDIARTVAVANATDDQHSVYERLAAAQDEVIASAVPGVKASELFATCRSALERRNLTLSLPHVGHSIGLGLHEKPMLSPYDHTPLADGMVFAIEPAVRGPGGIFHTEDLIVLTPDGGRPVSRSQSWDQLMVVADERARPPVGRVHGPRLARRARRAASSSR